MKNCLNAFRCLVFTVSFLTVVITGYGQAIKHNVKIEETLAAIDTAFVKNDTARFNQLMLLEEIQNYYAELAHKNIGRKAGAHKVLRVYADSAFVLLTGLPSFGNSGDETNSALHYSGIYLLKKNGTNWQIAGRIAFDRLNQIISQHMGLEVKPGEGITVNDTLTINVKDKNGFIVRLNHRASLNSVLLNGKKVPYSFNGGLLWVTSPLKQQQQLLLHYSLLVERDDKNVNSGYFGATYGHIRNQYCWHPFFSYASPNDRAEFVVHCSLPADYPLSTSLPQTDRTSGKLRFIEARSENPTFALSLYYDKDWQVSRQQKGSTNLVIYATKDFEPARDTLYRYFSETSDILSARFGPARSTYLGIVQDRSGGGNGWKNRSNNTIISAAKGSYLIVNGLRPRAIFGHEIAHGWTTPSGPAANFLSEGWATYCESYLLANRYADTIIKPFFASQRANYLNGGYEGKISLNNDYSNNGASYGKGAWIFYMIEKQLGSARFEAAMRMFIRSNKQDVNNFIQLVSREAGKDMAPMIRPWLENKTIPLLSIRQQDQRLIVRQEGDLFIFPLMISLKPKNGSYVNKTITINSREQSIDVSGIDLESYQVDPYAESLFQLKEK
jgi:hypothetical protein